MPILAYCGLDCTECPTFIATKTGDRALREKTAREWSVKFAKYTGRNNLRAEEMVCDGCSAADDQVYFGCRSCNIRLCARNQKVAVCAECGRFEGCKELTGFFMEFPDAKKRLERLRK